MQCRSLHDEAGVAEVGAMLVLVQTRLELFIGKQSSHSVERVWRVEEKKRSSWQETSEDEDKWSEEGCVLIPAVLAYKADGVHQFSTVVEDASDWESSQNYDTNVELITLNFVFWL